MDFLCVGDIIADIIVRTVDPVTFQNTCSVVKETLIRPGGDGLNNSIDLAKLGYQVRFVGRIGNDILGEFLVREGQNAGVDMSHSVRSANTPHAKSTILIDEKGNREFLYYRGSNAEFCAEDVPLALLDDCKVLQIGGTFHLPGFDGTEGAAALLKAAKAKGVLTSTDVTTDATGRWNETIKNYYPYLDYFLPSVEQARILAGTESVPQMARFFLERGVKNVVIKLGDQGSYYRSGTKAFYCGCYRVPVADPTGAGDAFTAGFLAGVVEGMSMEKCVGLGTAAAAFIVQEAGATTGMKDFNTIRDFIDAQEAPAITREEVL